MQGGRGYVGRQGICTETEDMQGDRGYAGRQAEDTYVGRLRICRETGGGREYAGRQGICREKGDMQGYVRRETGDM